MLIFKLIVTFFLSYLFIKFLIKYSKPMGLLHPHIEYKTKKTIITPVGGGIGIFLAFLCTFILFELDTLLNYWYMFLSILMVFFIGVIDDIKEVTPNAKFIVIVTAVFFLSFFDIYIDSFGSWFGYSIDLPTLIAIPFTIFALTGFTNALNLIDGLDGLAASISLVILGSFLYIGYVYNDYLIISMSLFTMVGIIAFLFFNWNPAKIYMGDSGSLYIGFIISLIAILSLEYIHPVAVLYLAAIPIVDTIIVMTRRIKRGLSPFSPDKYHIHHIVLNFFLDEKAKLLGKKIKRTVFFLVLMQILFSLAGLMISLNSNTMGEGLGSFVALIAFVGVVVLFYYVFTGMKRKQKLFEKLKKRKN